MEHLVYVLLNLKETLPSFAQALFSLKEILLSFMNMLHTSVYVAEFRGSVVRLYVNVVELRMNVAYFHDYVAYRLTGCTRTSSIIATSHIV